MKNVLLAMSLAALTTTAMAQATETYKIWNDKEPDPAKYRPRNTTTWTTTTTTTTYPTRTVYVDRPVPMPTNNAPIVKCTKNGKTTYSNTEPCQ